jgi:hypothetical protein
MGCDDRADEGRIGSGRQPAVWANGSKDREGPEGHETGRGAGRPGGVAAGGSGAAGGRVGRQMPSSPAAAFLSPGFTRRYNGEPVGDVP